VIDVVACGLSRVLSDADPHFDYDALAARQRFRPEMMLHSGRLGARKDMPQPLV